MLQPCRAASADQLAGTLKAITLYWKWVQEIGLQQTSEVIGGFEKDLARYQKSGATNTEKIHFMLGQLYESLAFPHRRARQEEWPAGAASSHLSTTQPTEPKHLVQILQAYGASLKCGHKHIFQSLPRLLTLWFENSFQSSQSQSKTLQEMHNVIKQLGRELPSYIWLSVYPQLISRITHPNGEVLAILSDIIGRVLAKHPRQVSRKKKEREYEDEDE